MILKAKRKGIFYNFLCIRSSAGRKSTIKHIKIIISGYNIILIYRNWWYCFTSSNMQWSTLFKEIFGSINCLITVFHIFFGHKMDVLVLFAKFLFHRWNQIFVLELLFWNSLFIIYPLVIFKFFVYSGVLIPSNP